MIWLLLAVGQRVGEPALGEQGSAETTDTTLPRRSHTIQRKGMGLVLWGGMQRGSSCLVDLVLEPDSVQRLRLLHTHNSMLGGGGGVKGAHPRAGG